MFNRTPRSRKFTEIPSVPLTNSNILHSLTHPHIIFRMIVAFDESGYNGQNLLDQEQPIFTLASVSFNKQITEELLAPFKERTSGEVKYSSLKKAKKNRELFLNLINSSIVSSRTCKIYAIDKSFMACAKMVDNIHETIASMDSIDLYEQRAARVMACLIHSLFPALIGQTRYLKYLSLFGRFAIKRSDEAFERFANESHNIYKIIRKKSPEASVYLVPVIIAIRKGVDFLRAPLETHS